MVAAGFSPRKKRQENARRRGATFDHRPPNFRPLSDVHGRLQASLRDALILGALRPWANAHGYLHPVAPRPRPNPISAAERPPDGGRGFGRLSDTPQPMAGRVHARRWTRANQPNDLRYMLVVHGFF